MSLGSDGIWGCVTDYGEQLEEKMLRQSVAKQGYGDHLETIRLHHSIPVMDAEVSKFLKEIPIGGVVLDIGGCWGWHWRKIHTQRPDIKLVIIDLVRQNLIHAKSILNQSTFNTNVWLVHGNALSLAFEDKSFDGVWSVQTTQHIPDFKIVCTELFRVLKQGGIYWDYGLNNARFVRLVYNLFRKAYHSEGVIEGKFYLRRVNKSVINTVKDTFNVEPDIRYSEILFTPDFGLPLGGKANSLLGKLDSTLTGSSWFCQSFARQHSFHVRKISRV